MPKLRRLHTLKIRILIWCGIAAFTTLSATTIWLKTNHTWDKYLQRIYHIGYMTYDNIDRQIDLSHGVSIKQINANPENTKPKYITNISILNPDLNQLRNAGVQILIHSPDFKYPVSRLQLDHKAPYNEQFGRIIQFIASHCSQPLIYVKQENRNWVEIDGRNIWGCQNTPKDYRMLAILIFISGLFLLITQIDNTTSLFSQFSNALRQTKIRGRYKTFSEQGPKELRDIIQSVNDHLSFEHKKLSQRALIMSSVSHDLGTPATRLRLRAALIEDNDLRVRLERDIDLMTTMIEGILSYTQSELDTEEMHQISLTSLVESIVDDYADFGKPVRLMETTHKPVRTTRFLFTSRHRVIKTKSEDQRRILVTVRPLALRRAITNLIDNALKYGRSAQVSIHATSHKASIIIKDKGHQMTAEELTELIKPFQRGRNSKFTTGTGLGLSIVSTIATQHGGKLCFERDANGVRALFIINRIN